MTIPRIQNTVAKIAIKNISKQINTDISLEKIRLRGLKTVEITGVNIKDRENNDFFSIGNAKITIDRLRLKKGVFLIKDVAIDSVYMNHVKYPQNYSSNLISLFPINTKENKENKKSVVVKCEHAKLTNLNYLYNDMDIERERMEIDFRNIDVRDVSTECIDILVVNDSVSLQILDLTLKETKGFYIQSFFSNFIISRSTLQANNTHILTPNSDLDLDLKFFYDSYKSYRYFLDSVTIVSEIRENSIVNLNDIACFTSTLAGADNPVEIIADVYGPVNAMDITDADIWLGKETYYTGNVFLRSVDNDMYLGLDIYDFTTSAKDFESFNVPAFKPEVYTPHHLRLPKELKKLGTIMMEGSFAGQFDNFNADINLETEAGQITVAANYLRNSSHINDFDVKLNGNNIDIGRILELSGKITSVDADIKVTGTAQKFLPKTFALNGMLTDIRLPQATLNNLYLNATKTEESFSANSQIYNENVILELFLNHFFDPQNPLTNISVSLTQANLKKLGLINYDGDFLVSSFFNVNANGDNFNDMDLRFTASDLTINANNNFFNIGNVSLSQNYNDSLQEKTIKFASSPLSIDCYGSFSYEDLPYVFKYIASNLVPKEIDKTDKKEGYDFCNFHTDIKILRPDIFTDIFMPRLSLSPNNRIRLDIQKLYNVALSVEAEDLQFDSYKLHNMSLQSNYDSIQLNTILNIDDIYLGDAIESSSLLNVDKFILKNISGHGLSSFDIYWHDSIYNNNSNLKFVSDLTQYPMVDINFPEPSYVFLQNNRFNIESQGPITFFGEYLSVDNLSILGEKTALLVNGAISNNAGDSLTAAFNNINISPVNMFLADNTVLSGILNGDITVSKTEKNPYISAGITVKDISMNNKPVGDLFLTSRWNQQIEGIYADVKVIGHDAALDTIVSVTGIYYPLSEEGAIKGQVTLNNVDFNLLSPYLAPFIVNPNGLISGKIDVRNNIYAPVLNGTLNFKRASMTVAYTGATYTFSNPVDIVPNAILFDEFKLYDNNGKSFNLSGSIRHNSFKDIRLALHTQFDRFIFLDNYTDGGDKVLYGSTILSGDASILGPTSDISISANVVTDPGTLINVALNSNKTAAEQSFIHFVSADTTEIAPQITAGNGYDITAKARINNDAELNLILPYSIGDMNISGTGDITYRQNNDGTFTVVGDYYVSSGKLKFSFQDIVSREFTIKEGGGIIFNGNPLDAIMDLQAVYQLRASLSGIPTITDAATLEKRVPVDCIINFTGTLADPQITFGIELPNTEEDIQELVFAAIDVNDQAKLSEQVFSLLVLKSFGFTSENSLISSGLGSSSLGILSAQIGNWLSLISKNLDIGVNYNPGDELTPEEVEVAIKTELFNNRVIIDSNIGVQNTSSITGQTAASSFVGDVVIEYKITKDGRLRAKAFNRSNDYNILEENGPYTQGVGLSYFTEFDKFSDLFKRKPKVQVVSGQ